MSKIHQLDDHLTNMIAAGEVVERPAGIVKELVENAIDAMASHIKISIDEGGMQRIEIADNGIGMDANDLSLAFDRHSTSKINTAHDLNNIITFGFRGEALPSIASVSHVDITTHDGASGHQLSIDYGVKSPLVRAARNKGTTIEVSNLFLRTPARLKYIKNVNYENAIIQDIVHKFAMSHPSIAFTLMLDGKMTFRSFGNGDNHDVFHRIYGTMVSEHTKHFEASNYDFEISGLYAAPQHNRSNRNAIWLTINGRMIRYPKVQRAIADSYRRHMPTDRYPIVVMNIKVSPNLVDVNVHPSKWEIRLSKESQLLELIQSQLEDLLNLGTHIPQLTIKPIISEVQPSFIDELDNPSYQANGESTHNDLSQIKHEIAVNEAQSELRDTIQSDAKPFTAILESSTDATTPPVIDYELKSVDRIETLNVLAQMSGKYILAQGDLGLYIIDQHAAMERVRYEYYQNQLLEKHYAMQDLLVAHLFEGRKALVMQIERVQTILQPMGINLEPFGDDSLVLRSVPTWIKEKEVSEFMNNVLDRIESDRSVREEDLRRRAIATLACHSSVRFNEFMSREEMIALIESLRECAQPFHCPHGRPTLIKVTHQQLIKEFSR